MLIINYYISNAYHYVLRRILYTILLCITIFGEAGNEWGHTRTMHLLYGDDIYVFSSSSWTLQYTVMCFSTCVPRKCLRSVFANSTRTVPGFYTYNYDLTVYNNNNIVFRSFPKQRLTAVSMWEMKNIQPWRFIMALRINTDLTFCVGSLPTYLSYFPSDSICVISVCSYAARSSHIHYLFYFESCRHLFYNRLKCVILRTFTRKFECCMCRVVGLQWVRNKNPEISIEYIVIINEFINFL